ncbi:MAG TPA: GNAT family N-acetyltransferase [Patescibacteria group bacterium]|nr:GNAT family N-acetyltransferase [Patescibacteria group bacterium]
MSLTISVIKNASPDLRSELKEFSDSNWGDHVDNSSEILLNFFLPFDIAILAKDGDVDVGLIEIFFKKNIVFGKGTTNVGGIGGVVVHKDYRHQKIATKMLSKVLEVLSREKFDIAMLCTDIKRLGVLYEKVGFVPLGRKYLFFDKNGKLKEETGGMIAEIDSKKMFDQILHSKRIINLGRGNF